MGFGFRVFLIDEEDKIIRIPTIRFDRLRNRDPKEALIQYKDSRIRYAMVGGILQKVITKIITEVDIYGHKLYSIYVHILRRYIWQFKQPILMPAHV
jgi:hypothetical protein